MKIFTKDELKKYDGTDGNPTYIAYKGKVYDVSESAMWMDGSHMGEHSAGEDLTEAIKNAPHEEDKLEDLPVIGELKEE